MEVEPPRNAEASINGTVQYTNEKQTQQRIRVVVEPKGIMIYGGTHLEDQR